MEIIHNKKKLLHCVYLKKKKLY